MRVLISVVLALLLLQCFSAEDRVVLESEQRFQEVSLVQNKCGESLEAIWVVNKDSYKGTTGEDKNPKRWYQSSTWIQKYLKKFDEACEIANVKDMTKAMAKFESNKLAFLKDSGWFQGALGKKLREAKEQVPGSALESGLLQLVADLDKLGLQMLARFQESTNFHPPGPPAEKLTSNQAIVNTDYMLAVFLQKPFYRERTGDSTWYPFKDWRDGKPFLDVWEPFAHAIQQYGGVHAPAAEDPIRNLMFTKVLSTTDKPQFTQLFHQDWENDLILEYFGRLTGNGQFWSVSQSLGGTAWETEFGKFMIANAIPETKWPHKPEFSTNAVTHGLTSDDDVTAWLRDQGARLEDPDLFRTQTRGKSQSGQSGHLQKARAEQKVRELNAGVVSTDPSVTSTQSPPTSTSGSSALGGAVRKPRRGIGPLGVLVKPLSDLGVLEEEVGELAEEVDEPEASLMDT